LKPEQRIVVSIPLSELWDRSGPIAATRGGYLNCEEIRGLLRSLPRRFVVADFGPLQWIEAAECFTFWKHEVQDHICEDLHAIHLDDCPGGYCYAASRWLLASGETVIVLEKYH
jgi:hypothetical protein